jgi:hypothetical protein
MPTYRVAMEKVTDILVTVEADDPDEAIDKAYENEPSLCAHCHGWGQDWSRDDDAEAEAYVVYDENDNTVWTKPKSP